MLDKSKAVLVVIDFQEKLLPVIPTASTILPQAIKLIRFARELDMPILWTEQYPRGLGHTVQSVATELHDHKPFEKTAFGCLGDTAFAEALSATGRSQIVVTGVEAHVCVMQTVLAAIDSGLDVFVPRDAVGSRAELEYLAGLARMESAGATVVTTEMAMFEALREAGTPEFKKILPLIK